MKHQGGGAAVTTTLRLMLADWLLGLALSLIPKGHPDGVDLARALEVYLRASIKRHQH